MGKAKATPAVKKTPVAKKASAAKTPAPTVSVQRVPATKPPTIVPPPKAKPAKSTRRVVVVSDLNSDSNSDEIFLPPNKIELSRVTRAQKAARDNSSLGKRARDDADDAGGNSRTKRP